MIENRRDSEIILAFYDKAGHNFIGRSEVRRTNDYRTVGISAVLQYLLFVLTGIMGLGIVCTER